MIQSNQQLQTRTILNANQFNCVRKIGKGGFGHVLLATKATSSSSFYAIKCLSKKKMIKDPQLKKGLIQEVNTMASLEHSNIVKLFKTFEEGDWYFLVMEYCDLGNLYTIQSKLPAKAFTLDEATGIFNQVLRGVEVIHKNQIVHRDIKLENIFVRKNEKGGLLCKIGDFGLARFVEMTANSNCGTQNYMAPEILRSTPYGQAVDVWSLGVLFFYLLFAEFPFKGINILEDIVGRCKSGFRLNDNVKIKSFFRSRKEEVLLNDLFSKIFEIDVEKRVTVAGMREHAALRGKAGEDESTEEQMGSEARAAIEWEINHMRFIQKIAKQVEISSFLSPFLLLAFKFYLNKAVLHLLNKETIKNYRKDKEGHPKLLKILADLQSDLFVKLERIIVQLRECKEGFEVIPNFDEGLNAKYQDFTKFKIGYRNTVGRVYEQVHKKYSQNTRQRASLKLKVFLCHIINRVFVGGFNANIFPHFASWAKKEKGKLGKLYDFRLIEEWIQAETIENLTASQEIINKAFYK